MDNRRGWTLVITAVGLNALAIILFVVLAVMGADAALTGDPGSAAGALLLMIAAYGLILIGFGVFVGWFATQNRDMNRITGGRFNTALWTVLLIVPIANIISLYKFADHIHQAQTQRGVTGMHPVVLFLLMWLINIVGWPLAQTQMAKLG